MLIHWRALAKMLQELQRKVQAHRTHWFCQGQNTIPSPQLWRDTVQPESIVAIVTHFCRCLHFPERDALSLQVFFLFMIILGKKQKCRNGAAETVPVTSPHKNSPVTVTGFHSDSKTAFHVCLKPELLAKARSRGSHVKQVLICCTFGFSLSCNPSLKIHPHQVHVSCVSLSVCKNPYGFH